MSNPRMLDLTIKVALDANVLIAASDPTEPHYASCNKIIALTRIGKLKAYISAKTKAELLSAVAQTLAQQFSVLPNQALGSWKENSLSWASYTGTSWADSGKNDNDRQLMSQIVKRNAGWADLGAYLDVYKAGIGYFITNDQAFLGAFREQRLEKEFSTRPISSGEFIDEQPWSS